MSIRVTCAGCHTRFNVNEKFAGREGPCPKCKKTIKVPKADEEVQVHAPQEFGPKGSSGQAVLKPLFRTETRLSPVQIVLIASTIIGLLAVAFLINVAGGDKDRFSTPVLVLLAMLVAIPCVQAAYAFLRDSELGWFSGQELAIRVGCCSVAYGLGWLAFYVANLAVVDDFGTTTLILGVAAMFILGSLAANLFLGLDFLVGILHYGMYFGVCLLLRLVAGFSALPSSGTPPVDDITLAGLGQTFLLAVAV